jgi:capsular polysaccharide biosynthesis protein
MMSELCRVEALHTFPMEPENLQSQAARLEQLRLNDSTLPPEFETALGVLILRTDAVERRIHNREEVLDVCRRHQIMPISPSVFTIAENVKMLDESDVIIAAERSGLIDAMFLDPPNVIMFCGSRHDTVFKEVISMQGGDCELVECEQVNSDFIVNLDALETMLVDMT